MKIGFIGLGTMGRHMARHLQEAGYELVVNDVRKEAADDHVGRGAVFAATPAEIMAECDVVFTSLPMPKDVEEVALGPAGLIQAATPGKVFVDLSTNSPTVVKSLHAIFAEKGVEVIDSPISGGEAGAESGKLVFMVGGDEAAFNKIRPYLAAMGDQQVYVGEIGDGTVAKLVHNLASQSMAMAFAEAFSIGVAAGVDPLVLWKAIRQGAGGRSRRPYDAVRFLTGDVEKAGFRLALAHKDISLATQLARELRVPVHISQLANDDLGEAMLKGWGNKDMTALLELQKERANVTIEVQLSDIEAEIAKG
jgi:3-hydroxyisobutyrate dehydrogenase